MDQLLTEKEVAAQTGLSIYSLWHMRQNGRGIPFIKTSPGRYGRVRYRQQDVDAFLIENPPKKKKAQPKHKPITAPTAPVTISCEDAARRHGLTPRNIARMCLRGTYLAKRYGGASRVPAKELRVAIFAKKVGRSWRVPVSELDRVFLP